MNSQGTQAKASYDHPRVLSPQEVGERLDPLAPGLEGILSAGELGRLPYSALMGPGFERLCFQLELAEGRNPQFFGKPGQRDYAVDIVVDDAGERTVIQCRNLGTIPTWTEIRSAVNSFEAEWLQEIGLPRPQRYVYCCPQPLDDTKIIDPYLRFKDEFHARTGVEIVVRGRDYLDARLGRLPDLVTSLFSVAIAEQFCGVDDWKTEPWVRICRGMERHKPVERFVQRHDNKRIYVSDNVQRRFEDALERDSVVLIRGLPGSGKTLTGLELASRLTEPMRCIYYASLKENPAAQLWQTARQRCNLPSVFVLDDCHMDFAAAETLMERLSPELKDPRRVILILIYRHMPVYEEDTGDTDLVQVFEQDELIIDFRPDVSHTRAVTEFLRSDLIGLSRQRLEHLHHSTGGDLLLLDEALESIASPADIDGFETDELYAALYRHYFGGKHVLRTVRRLAGLAQFDLLPLSRFFDDDWQTNEYSLASPLIGEVFGPPRYRFLHSSLAELVFNAMVRLEVPPTHGETGMVRLAVNGLVDYFRFLLDQVHRGNYAVQTMVRDLESVVRGRLNLCSEVTEAGLKADFLSDEAVLGIFEAQLDRVSFGILRIICNNYLSDGKLTSNGEHSRKSQYLMLVVRKLRSFLSSGDANADPLSIRTIGTGLSTLGGNAPEELEGIQEEFGATGFLRLLTANGTVFELFHTLQYTTPEFAGQLLEILDENAAEQLVANTIESSRSIGTLSLAMRRLGLTDETLLKRLESAIGPERFLRLLMTNGTMFELFRNLQHTTPEFAGQVLEHLDEHTVEQLVTKTIESGRSVGTLHLTLRQLGKTDKVLLEQLQSAIGPERFLRLLTANGTVSALFRTLEHTTPEFAGELLERLDEHTVELLVAKTIDSRRSIGTLHFALRQLGEVDTALLDGLESAIGPERFLRLLTANGTVFELFRILEYTTREFAVQLLEHLDEHTVEQLVAKTIASGRSIGTLHLAMRQLGLIDETLLKRLQSAIGFERFLLLFTANGTVFELFHTLQNTTPEFAGQLLEHLDEHTVDKLVAQTIESGRSIGTLPFPMRQLGKTDKVLLEQLQSAIGPERFLRLFRANGTVSDLFNILRYTTPEFAGQLLKHLDKHTVEQMVAKTIESGSSIGALHFTLRQLGKADTVLLEQLENAVGVGGWWSLFGSVGSLNSLTQISRAMTEPFREIVIEASTGLGVAEWQRIILAGRFLNARDFVKDEFPTYPVDARVNFREALAEAAPALAETSTWFDLYRGRSPTDRGSPEGSLLREAVQQRLGAVRLEDLPGLEFREAVNAYALSWLELPELRTQLVARIWEVLPAPEQWPKTKGGGASVWPVLAVACMDQMPVPIALRLVDVTRGILSLETSKKTQTLPLFLLVWNLAALWREKGPGKSFGSTLPEATFEILCEILRGRVRAKGPNAEKLAQLSLAGLIRFLDVDSTDALRKALEPLAGASPWLRKRALDLSFISGLFALEGIALLEPASDVFTQQVCVGLLAKAVDYERVGPAVQDICALVRSYSSLQ